MTQRIVVCAVAVLTLASLAAAEDNTRKLSLGLAYLATSGNSDSSTFGLDLKLDQQTGPWGLETVASFMRAATDGELTAERYSVGVRGKRQVAERWQVFVGASGLKDEFAGLDSRLMLESGATFLALKNDTHELSFDAGVAWNREKQVTGGTESYMSGIAGARYQWTITETSAFTQRVVFLPSFDDSRDWTGGWNRKPHCRLRSARVRHSSWPTRCAGTTGPCPDSRRPTPPPWHPWS